MNNLIIDIGNTRIKCAIFKDNRLDKLHFFDGADYAACKTFLKEVEAQHCILSTTQEDNLDFLQFLLERYKTIEFTHKTALPIGISYQTPETLGDDRKAAICGAVAQAGSLPILVITAGTCITYNYFDGEHFVGGGISPGLMMRYRAMNEFTGKLPLVENADFDNLIGMTTEESLQSGARQGILAEVEGIIQQYRLLHSNLEVFLCGGDTNFFESRLKSKIFASPNLVLHGLNHILQYNKTV